MANISILIKSFFRPYLLDRCLYSIIKNVTGDYHIVVLDDGTPDEYINKIKEKYPQIQIVNSFYRKEKIEKIEKHLSGDKKYYDVRIPSSLWWDEINNSSDFLIFTEDDVWFTKPFNLKIHEGFMQNKIFIY